jgi:hypothetical protein
MFAVLIWTAETYRPIGSVAECEIRLLMISLSFEIFLMYKPHWAHVKYVYKMLEKESYHRIRKEKRRVERDVSL